MGEAKRKSRKRGDILAAELRCIYCANPAQTVEHMPPRGMFRGRLRPSAMEFGCCEDCNEATRGADAVAALFARTHPDYADTSWQTQEMMKLVSAVDAFAPGVREEMSAPGKSIPEWGHRDGSPVLQRVVRVRADGPLVQANLCAFGAKLAMALYREHVGTPLPFDGVVWCQSALNAGMTQEALDARLQILPLFDTLRQGKFNVQEQFAYRYNCDNRATLGAVAQFHRGLWITLFASSDPKIVALLEEPKFVNLPASALIRPGDLRKSLTPQSKLII